MGEQKRLRHFDGEQRLFFMESSLRRQFMAAGFFDWVQSNLEKFFAGVDVIDLLIAVLDFSEAPS